MDPFSYLSEDDKHKALAIKEYLDEEPSDFEAKRYVDGGENCIKFENGTGKGSISLIYSPRSSTVTPRKRKRIMSHTTAVSGDEVEVLYSGAIEREDVKEMLENARNAESSSNPEYEVKTSGNA